MLGYLYENGTHGFDMDVEMMNLREAADLLNVSLRFVSELVEAGKFRGVEVVEPGQTLLPRLEVDRVDAEMRAIADEALTQAANIRRGKGRPEKPLTGRWVQRTDSD